MQFKNRHAPRQVVAALACAFGLGLPAAQAQTPAAVAEPAASASAPPAAPSRTPPALTLDQLVSMVLLHNPDLLSVQRTSVTAAAGIVNAGALPNPTLEYNGGRQNPVALSSTSGSVRGWGVSQLIENPSLRQARLDAARSDQRGSLQQIEVQRNQLVAEVRLTAYQYLLRKAEAEAAADALSLLEQVQARVKARVDSGEAPRYELIKAESEIINARQLRDSALLLVEQTAMTLNRLAAGQLPARWTLKLSLDAEDPSALLPEALEQEALERNPELALLQAAIDRSRADAQLARSSRWPGVTLRYGQNRDPDVKQNVIGVGVQVPLFDQRSGAVAAAESELLRAQGRLEGRRAELRQQVLQAGKLLEMARLKEKALSQGAVKDAEAALRVAEAAYRYGERGILDVLDAQRVLRSLRADLLLARYQIQAARIELEALAGRHAATVPQPLPSLPDARQLPAAAPAQPASTPQS